MRLIILTTLLLGTVLTGTPLVMATPTTIMDMYSGGTPTHNYPLVDSTSAADFDLSKIVVDFVGNTLTVDIYADHNPGDWSGSSKFNLHWGMNSGHDVIQGSDPASFPEPATMLFCGTGLFGLAGLAGGANEKNWLQRAPNRPVLQIAKAPSRAITTTNSKTLRCLPGLACKISL